MSYLCSIIWKWGRKKTGKETESYGFVFFQTKQWLKKALLNCFHFHQKGNVGLADGVMLMQH